MRSVIADGLIKVEGWDGILLDEAMARMHDLFITHYDDPGSWAFAIWLRLTEPGKRIAKELEANASQSGPLGESP